MPILKIQLPRERSRAQELYVFLRAAILNGTLAPNERLVEETIAALASVSRTPVREAIRKLQVDGLVQDTAQGVVVCAMNVEELAELGAVRETLEGMASRTAAMSRSDLDLLNLRRILDDYREATERHEVDSLVAINHIFHETIWRAARNRYLYQQLVTLRGLIERLQPTTLDIPGRQQQALHQHELVLAAIANRNGDEAERLAREHFREAMAIRLMRENLDTRNPAARSS